MNILLKIQKPCIAGLFGFTYPQTKTLQRAKSSRTQKNKSDITIIFTAKI